MAATESPPSKASASISANQAANQAAAPAESRPETTVPKVAKPRVRGTAPADWQPLWPYEASQWRDWLLARDAEQAGGLRLWLALCEALGTACAPEVARVEELGIGLEAPAPLVRGLL